MNSFVSFPSFLHPWHWHSSRNSEEEKKDLDFFIQKMHGNEVGLEELKAWKKEIEQQFHKENELSKIDQFLEEFIKLAISSHCLDSLLWLLQIVNLSSLESIVRRDQPDFDLEESIKREALTSPCSDCSIGQRVRLEWRSSKFFIAYLMALPAEIGLGVLTILGDQKQLTTLWDRYLIFQIFYKIISLPKLLIEYLSPLLGKSIKVYAVVFLALQVAALFLLIYQRWLRPFPFELAHYPNERQIRVEQQELLNDLYSKLLGHNRVILCGPSGSGKTSLMETFSQLRQEGYLPAPLQNKQLIWIKGIDCSTNRNFQGYDVYLKFIQDKIKGHEENAILFLDEIDCLLENSSFLQAVKQSFLDHPSLDVVVATTTSGYDKICESAVDKDSSFSRRLSLINVDPKEPDARILYSFMEQEARDIPFLVEGIKAIVQEIKKSDSNKPEEGIPGNKPEEGIPGKMIRIMKLAIGECRLTYSAYTLKELNEKKRCYQELSCKEKNENQEINLLELKQLHQEIEFLEQKLRKRKEQIEKVARYQKEKNCFQTRYYYPLISKAKKAFSEEERKLYLLYHFYVRRIFGAKIQESINLLKNEDRTIALQIDRELVEKVAHTH